MRAKRPVDEVTKLAVRELLEDLASGKVAPRGKPPRPGSSGSATGSEGFGLPKAPRERGRNR